MNAREAIAAGLSIVDPRGWKRDARIRGWWDEKGATREPPGARKERQRAKRRAKIRRWRAAHPEKAAEYSKKYRKTYYVNHRGEQCLKGRRYYEEHKESVKARQALYRAKNREALRAKGLEYSRAHRAQQTANTRRRREQKRLELAIGVWTRLPGFSGGLEIFEKRRMK